MAEDPGWVPAIGNFWRFLVFPQLAMRMRRVKGIPALIIMRSWTIAGPASWLIFYTLLATLNLRPRPNGAAVWFAALIGDGLLSLVILFKLRVRTQGGASDPKEVASLFRGFFFLQWAIASSVVLVGFVVVFSIGRLWVFPLAMGLGILEFGLIAPTGARIKREQDRLRASHSRVDLLTALLLPNGDVPQRPKRR